MRNQFYYTVQQENGDAPKVTGSFSVDMVVRTIEYEPTKFVVLLNDFHEEQGKRPAQKANGKGITMASFKETVYSSIYLNEEDSARFRSLLEVVAPAFVEEA